MSAGVMIERNFSRFDQYLTLIFSSQNAAGAISRSDPFTVILEGTGNAAAQLAFTAVPNIGSLQGKQRGWRQTGIKAWEDRRFNKESPIGLKWLDLPR